MADRTPVFGRSISMPVLQEQNEDATSNSDGTIVPEEQSHTPTQSPGLHGSHQQRAGIWTRNRNGFTNPWTSANTPKSVDDSKLAQANTAPQKTWLPGLEHRSPTADTPTSPKELPAPSGSFVHHRRNSSHLSSYPDVPSPLAIGSWRRPSLSHGTSLMSPLSSPHRSQQSEQMTQKTPQKLDLHILKVSANSKGSPYHKPKGFGHSRKITDPFVDHVKSEDQSPLPSPFLTQATRKMEHISSFQGGSIELGSGSSPGSPFAENGYGGAAASTPQAFQSPMQQHGFYASSMPTFSPLPAMSPMAADFKPSMDGASRVDLPIPPPILSSVEGKLVMTPATRARHDARIGGRAEWIREGAKTIAALGSLSSVAGRRYEQTGTKEDYETWQALVTAFEDATDLNKRHEERRNMFMPAGMQSMRMGADNIIDDRSASFAVGDEDSEGGMLGFQMAYLERVCAEVKRRDDEKKNAELEEDAEITTEMINTMSLDEKKELKKYLLARLDAAAARKN